MKDERLYMTFPNDMHRHPKVKRLPVEVRWTFFEMNGEARIADNDGRFTAEDAEFMWPKEHLDALLKSHPSRPLVVRDGTDYVIREYAKHQQTRAEREALRAARAEAGRKGGLAKSKARPKHLLSPSKQTQAESESESEDLTKTSKSQSSSNRARVSTDAIPISPMTKRLAAQKGITSLRAVVDAIHAHTSCTVTADEAFQLAVIILDRAPEFPGAPQRYVTGAIKRHPAEAEQALYEQIGVVA